jgi:3-deoxy-7-phosphoheptulonate synthase
LLVEVHPDPATARSDGEQSLTFAEFDALMRQAVPFAQAAGRTLTLAAPQPARVAA